MVPKMLLLCALSLLLSVVAYARKPNIVLVLTDDQDLLLDSLSVMPQLKKLVTNEGVSFTNTFVNTPVCCPSRSTLLTGKHLHNLNVQNNSISGNCSSVEWQENEEVKSFATYLQSSGYNTFYAGKYLNQYGSVAAGGVQHVPAGYDWWIGLVGNSKYYNYTLSVNGTARVTTTDYLTDVVKEYGLEFLKQGHIATEPFMMVLSSPAPHAPFAPAPRHKDLFPDAKVVRTPSFNHTSAGKHWLMTMPPNTLPSDGDITLDDIQRRRLQTLVSVDEMVQEVIQRLEEIGILDETYVIFTSDNGYHIGQFTQAWDKRQPYDTDVRIPLSIRGPGVRQKSVIDYPITYVDFAPTILDIAGILEEVQKVNPMDGVSFLPRILEEVPSSIEQEERFMLVEYFGEGDLSRIEVGCPWIYDPNVSECKLADWCMCEDSRNNTYTCIRHLGRGNNFKYCEWYDEESFVEIYDLVNDPNEFDNLRNTLDVHLKNKYKSLLDKLKKCKGSTCEIA